MFPFWDLRTNYRNTFEKQGEKKKRWQCSALTVAGKICYLA